MIVQTRPDHETVLRSSPKIRDWTAYKLVRSGPVSLVLNLLPVTYKKGSLLLGSGVVSGVVRFSGVVSFSGSVGSLGVSPVIACRKDLFARSFAMSEAFSWGMGPREVTKHSVFLLSGYSGFRGVQGF
jgi:hypothetical protein